MERVRLVAQPRPEVGKNAVKRVRQAGMVPAVLYGRNLSPMPLAIDRICRIASWPSITGMRKSIRIK